MVKGANAAKVGFVFSTKDRVNLSIDSLHSIDTEGGFDLIWVDGSDTAQGKFLPDTFKFYNCKLSEVHRNIKGGPDKAIRFGLKRLMDLGYDYCGLIENDIVFKHGWYSQLMRVFELGKKDGLQVGAVTARTVDNGVLVYRPQYGIMWNTGAGMVLFTREAANIVLSTYGIVTAKKLSRFYSNLLGDNLQNRWALWMDRKNRLLGCDWAYNMRLYKYGLVSLGIIPSMAVNIDQNISDTRTFYVKETGEYFGENDIKFSRLLDKMSRSMCPLPISLNTEFFINSLKLELFLTIKNIRKSLKSLIKK